MKNYTYKKAEDHFKESEEYNARKVYVHLDTVLSFLVLSKRHACIDIIKKYKIHIILFLIASFAYLPISYTLAAWDQYQYFIGAKSILQNHVYLVDGGASQYPMGYSLLIVPFFYFFGINEQSAVIPCAIMGALVVVILYEFVRELIDTRAALFASLFLMVSCHWWLATNIRSDVPAMFFILLSIFAGVKYARTEKKVFVYLFYFAAGFACLIRYTSTLIFIVMLFYILLSKRVYLFKHKEVWIGILPFFVILSPQIIYNQIYFGSIFTTGYSHEGSLNVLKYFSYPLRYTIKYAEFVILGFQTPIFPFFVYGIWDWFKKRNYEDLSLVLPWIAIYFVIFSLSYHWFSSRHLHPMFPAMLILAGNGFSKMCSVLGIGTGESKIKPDKKRIRKILVILLVITILTPTILFNVNNIQKREDYGMLQKMTFTWIRENSGDDDIIIAADVPTYKYHSQREVYSLTLPKSEIKELISTHNNTYLAVREGWKFGHDVLQEDLQHMLDTVQWLNETYDLIHVKTFEIKRDLPLTSKVIFTIGKKTGLLSPYTDRWDIYQIVHLPSIHQD